jgi:pentalenolactone synthase
VVNTVGQLPFKQAHPLEVPPQLSELRSEGRIHRVRTAIGHEAWLITRHADVQRFLDDHARLGWGHPDPDNAARIGESALFGGPVGNYATEHADHQRMRNLLQPMFGPKHMRALRPRVAAITAGCLDELVKQGPPADLCTVLALPLPVLVICELLGVPYADREQFCAWTEDAGNTTDRARSEYGLAHIFAYGVGLVAVKRTNPGDDVISRLCENEGLSDEQTAGLGMTLLIAGHHTVRVQVELAVLLLLGNRDQWQAVVNDPDSVPNAVEELLRAACMGGGQTPRYARTELEIDGVTINPGDLVLLDVTSSNHDPTVFDDPNQLDITRAAGNHLTFGHGPRYCIGAPLARIELQEVVGQLAARFPTMHLVKDAEELTLRPDVLTGGVTELPVRW